MPSFESTAFRELAPPRWQSTWRSHVAHRPRGRRATKSCRQTCPVRRWRPALSGAALTERETCLTSWSPISVRKVYGARGNPRTAQQRNEQQRFEGVDTFDSLPAYLTLRGSGELLEPRQEAAEYLPEAIREGRKVDLRSRSPDELNVVGLIPPNEVCGRDAGRDLRFSTRPRELSTTCFTS